MSGSKAAAKSRSASAPAPSKTAPAGVLGRLDARHELPYFVAALDEMNTAIEHLARARAEADQMVTDATERYSEARGAVGSFARHVAHKLELDPTTIRIERDGRILPAAAELVPPDVPLVPPET